jgi:hypothetical protein
MSWMILNVTNDFSAEQVDDRVILYGFLKHFSIFISRAGQLWSKFSFPMTNRACVTEEETHFTTCAPDVLHHQSQPMSASHG